MTSHHCEVPIALINAQLHNFQSVFPGGIINHVYLVHDFSFIFCILLLVYLEKNILFLIVKKKKKERKVRKAV